MEYLTREAAVAAFEGKLPFRKSEFVELETSKGGSFTFERYLSPALDYLGLGKCEYGIEKRIYRTTHAEDGGEDVVRYLSFFRSWDIERQKWDEWEEL